MSVQQVPVVNNVLNAWAVQAVMPSPTYTRLRLRPGLYRITCPSTASVTTAFYQVNAQSPFATATTSSGTVDVYLSQQIDGLSISTASTTAITVQILQLGLELPINPGFSAVVDTITTSGTYTQTGSNAVVCIVGGGGAGGRASSGNDGGGGGSGGVRVETGVTLTGSISVTIGSGGAGGTTAPGASGGTTSFGAFTATGGGGGPQNAAGAAGSPNGAAGGETGTNGGQGGISGSGSPMNTGTTGGGGGCGYYSGGLGRGAGIGTGGNGGIRGGGGTVTSATGYGAGGGGASDPSTSGSGSPGVVYVLRQLEWT